MRLVSLPLFLLLAVSASLLAAVPQHNAPFQEGIHYFSLPEPVAAVEVEDKLEVTEVFWYGCSYCFHFEPLVLAWLEDMDQDVHFVRIPAMWNVEMEQHARAYYTIKRLGVLEQAHQAIYNAINVDGARLNSAEELAEFLSAFELEAEKVADVYSSAETTALLKAAHDRARAYQISGTPQLIVHGRYRVQASEHLPRSQMFKVVDYLLEKIRAEQAEATDQSSNEKALL